MSIRDAAGREFQPGPEFGTWQADMLMALEARDRCRIHYADACDRVEKATQRARQAGAKAHEIQDLIGSFQERTRF